MAEYYILRVLKPIKAGTRGVYNMICKPLDDDAPAGRRVRMQLEDAAHAVLSGQAQMLSPGGTAALSTAAQTADVADKAPKAKAAPKRRFKPGYKTSVQTADVDD